MRLLSALGAAAWALAARPLRTGAVVSALAAGVATAVMVATVVEGFGREIDQLAFGAYGRALVVRENVMVQDRHGPPDLGDLSLLQAELRPQGAAAWLTGRGAIARGAKVWGVGVFGAWGDYRTELDSPLASGRWITAEETRTRARVCLLGAGAADRLDGPVAAGMRLMVNGVACEVVGVLGWPRSRPAARFSDGVVTPYDTAARLLEDERAPGEADWLTLLLPPGADLQAAGMQADRVLRRAHGAPLSRPSPFEYGDPGAAVQDMQRQRAMLSRLLMVLAGLCLLTSLLAFAALSASALAARTREIALRMAMGAGGADIQAQVLLESLGAGLLGGAAGLLAGAGLARLAAALWGWPFAPTFGVGMLALGLGLLTGLGVGAAAARRAAALPPALAARA